MHSTVQKIRVRMAPSPTGKLHAGTARTAIFNWLFARKNGGTFILRMEDTDAERSKSEFEMDIIETLRWLGIDWDEGPDIGGAHGPYRQTERINQYRKYLERLLQERKAYYCFCKKGEQEVEYQAIHAAIVPRYNGKCRSLSLSESDRRIQNGESAIIRFRTIDNGVVGFDDSIRGRVEFPAKDIGGDFVIARNITSPLYNLAVVCDDFDMQITHVIRGEDHISNTPRQILIQQALEFPSVRYAHVPLILNSDRSKMSKRKGLSAISEYRIAGYLPEALLNFFALLGWHPIDDDEILSAADLTKKFSLERIQKGGAVFDIAKLDWMNGEYIQRVNTDSILEHLSPGILERNWKKMPDSYIRMVIDLEKPRMKKLSDFYDLAEPFFVTPTYDTALLHFKRTGSPATLESLRKIYQEGSGLSPEPKIFAEKLGTILEHLSERSGKGPVYWPLRVALSGRKASPGPLEIAVILGKDETLHRVSVAIEKLGNQ